MFFRNLFFALSLVLLTFSNSYSSVLDTIRPKPNPLSDETEFLDNIDSLTNNWYIQQSLKTIHDKEFAINHNSSDYIPEFSDQVYKDRLAKLPAIVNLVYNDKVKAFIDVYSKKKREKTEILLGLSDYYFPLFEAALDAFNLPHELKYLAVIESALNPLAVSRVGATGLWQFMYGTGKLYNLEINSLVDDRRDPLKATYAAAKYLKDLYGIFNDWSLAIAAYNCGPGNVRKAMARSKGKTDFWQIYSHLPRETRGYLPAFIAATYVMNYYKEHNIYPKKIALPLITDTIVLNHNLHLQQVAEVLSIPIEQLRELNPQYKRDIIPAAAKAYSLRLPYSYSVQFINLQDSILSYKDSIYFNKTSKNCNLIELSKSNPAALTSNTKRIRYLVKKGDNIKKIAQKHEVTIDEIKDWNRLKKSYVYAGQKLTLYVPVEKKTPPESQAKDNKTSTQPEVQKGKTDTNQHGKPDDIKITKNSSPRKDTLIKQTPSIQNKTIRKYVYYKVIKGDTLWEIAKKFPGVSGKDILSWNNIKNANQIIPGQVLKIMKE
jgi:membrane-bound lytic murein transglycosylase D